MLEFYSVPWTPPADSFSHFMSMPTFIHPLVHCVPRQRTWGNSALQLPVVLVLCIAAGCATIPPAAPPTAPPLPRTAEPPPPKINLSGFPLAYRQGYADGCASATGAERKDGERFGKDGNYSMGWQDGVALCRKKR